MKKLFIAFLLTFMFISGGFYYTNKSNQKLRLGINSALKLHYVEMRWDTDSYLKGGVTYNVYRTEDGVRVDTLATGLNKTEFYDFNVKSKHSYSYMVSATNAEGKESGFVNVANVDIP